MLFPTVTFAAFFLVVFTLSWLLMPSFRLWKVFMVAVSYVFYGAAGWTFTLLIVASTVINQFCAVMVHRGRGRARDTRRSRQWTTRPAPA